MSMINLFKRPDINRGVEEYYKDLRAILLDVRTPEEYRAGHIPESENIPLQSLEMVTSLTQNPETELYVYCHSGARSRQAVSQLRDMGYKRVRNIGGIASYTGKVVR